MSDTPKLFELVYECTGTDITPHEIHEYFAAPSDNPVRAHYDAETTRGNTIRLVGITEVPTLEQFLETLTQKRGTRHENGRNITHKNHITFLT